MDGRVCHYMYYSRFCFTSQRFTLCYEIHIHHFSIKDCFPESMNSVCVFRVNVSHLRYDFQITRKKNVDQINMKGRRHSENHNWSDINSRFEQLFSMNDVSEENKREIFLALCGDVYERLSNDASIGRGEPLECHHGHHYWMRKHRGHHGPRGHGHGKPGHRHHPHHGPHKPGHHGPHKPGPHGHGKPEKHGICDLHGRFRSLSIERH